jgi:hypothetical protein
MNVPPVSATHGAAPVTGPSGPPTPALNGTIDGIAQGLAMQTTMLKSALGSGTSLASIAQDRGVSRNDLSSVVRAEVDRRRAALGQDPIDPAVADRMVSRAIDRRSR